MNRSDKFDIMAHLDALGDAYLATAEADARRFSGAYTGTSGTLAGHVMRLLGEVRRLKAVIAYAENRSESVT